MTQEIRIPDIGDAEDVEVVEVLVSAGDQVSEDDPVIVIESDKASMEVPANVTGTIDAVTVSVGDKVTEGQVIARLRDAPKAQEQGDQQQERPPGRDSGKQQAARADRGQEAAAEPEAAAESKAAPADAEAAPAKASAETEVEVKVPDIGEAENVEVIEVAVKPGDHVDEDDLLVVVESDKASMEIPSSHAGTIREVHVSVGTQVEEGTLLVTLLAEGAAADRGREAAPTEEGGAEVDRGREAAPTDDAGTEVSRGREAAPTEAAAAAPEGDERAARRQGPFPPPAAAQPAPAGQEPASSGTSVYAGPAVRRLARELGVNLSAVNGTGNRGRIVKDDVKAHVKARMTGPPTGAGGAAIPPIPEVDFSRFGEIEEQPLSRTRASGAQNLHRSWLNIPHVTQHDEVDVSDLEEFRASLKAEGERRGVKVTPLAFIIKACCHVLKEFPTFNASLDPSAKTFILKRYYHIGMAVDTPDGLVVPVIRDADRKGVWELSAEVAELADKARNKKLGMDEMRGGSFSVSSLGAIGGTGFTPIINAPEVAILGVGRLSVRPVWRSEAFVPRKMLPLSLSYDHRAVNGAEAGRFVTRLGELLGDIRRLAL